MAASGRVDTQGGSVVFPIVIHLHRVAVHIHTVYHQLLAREVLFTGCDHIHQTASAMQQWARRPKRKAARAEETPERVQRGLAEGLSGHALRVVGLYGRLEQSKHPELIGWVPDLPRATGSVRRPSDRV
jgi:hypothetical protein